MSSSSIENSTLDSLIASYEPQKTETSANDELGSEQFLTLLVAQLENQNPMDPADSDQFTDQLAQFTQVEQLISLNDKMDEMATEKTESESDVNPSDYVGMQVTGTANAMTIEDGSVSSGFYELTETSEVSIVIQDEDGNIVTTLDEGQKEAGAFLIAWDGTDDDGAALDEGTYTYTVLANAGDGYEELSSTITGTVDAVTYQNGNAYLVVGGILMSPSSVTTVTESPSDEPAASILEYLGTTVSSNYPIVQVEDGTVTGEALSYDLDASGAVTVTIYNANDEAVATIEMTAEETVAGDNEVTWDAQADSGSQVSDGLYYYTVETDSGSAKTPVSGEVTGIQYVNGSQYLALGNSGRLVSLSTVTSVE